MNPKRTPITHKIRDYMRRTPMFDTGSVIRVVGNKNYAYVLLNRLLKSGEIKRITRRYYTIHEDPSILVYCIKPAYLGLQDAMSFHNLWEQETAPIILTCRKVRPGERITIGSNAIVRRITPRHFFGYEYMKQGDLLLPVSDVEKTFIDMVYFREMRKDMLPAFRKSIDREKLAGYLKRYDRRLAGKVLKLLG
jgi:predicted transcriptional regulator of viral defense system